MADNRKRQERRFDFQVRSVDVGGEQGQQELWVEGCAARIDSPTVLYVYDGVEYKEQIARGAFDECNMTDVIFNYNHGGKVIARTRNNTLQLSVREDGLYVRARLDGTEEGRRLYDEISKGYIDRMSFRFDIGDECYDNEQTTWTIYRVKKLWDVSAVDLPAYDDTMIEARKADAAEARIRQSQRARDAAQARIHLRSKRADLRRRCALLAANTITGGMNHGDH